jgi:hypothetical protein
MMSVFSRTLTEITEVLVTRKRSYLLLPSVGVQSVLLRAGEESAQ